jgi:uncharacterized membrane protein
MAWPGWAVQASVARSVLFRTPCPEVAMLYNLLKLSHVLSIVVWVGGMVFAHFFLRPAVAALQPPDRLSLMHAVLGRFFKAVLWLSTWAVVSGVWMIGRVAKEAVQSGGSFQMPLSWTVMATVGLAMWLIFGHIRFVLYKRMSGAVVSADWPAAGASLASIRQWVLVNMVLGLLIIGFVLFV